MIRSNQTRKNWFCHVIVKNYLSNVSWTFLIKIESTWRREIKEQATQLILLYRGRTVRSSRRRCCIRKLFLKILEHLRWSQLYWKDTPTQVFSYEYWKFLILPILKNICKRLVFNFSNGSLLHGPKVLKPRLHDGVRLQGLSHASGLVFVFKSASLAMKQNPACIRKPKRNYFW